MRRLFKILLCVISECISVNSFSWIGWKCLFQLDMLVSVPTTSICAVDVSVVVSHVVTMNDLCFDLCDFVCAEGRKLEM
jgi:hypothetical protein